MKEKGLTNIELFYLITKQYLSTKDIKKVLGIGINQANQVRKNIEAEYCKDMLLPKNKIPSMYLIKERNIDVDQIFENAKKEKELKGE
jgi:hypothetical protein